MPAVRSKAVSLVCLVDRNNLQYAHRFVCLNYGVDRGVRVRDMESKSIAAAIDRQLFCVTVAAARIRVVREIPKFLRADSFGLLIGNIEELIRILSG